MSVPPPALYPLPLTPGSPLLLKLRLKAAATSTALDLTGAQVKLAFFSEDGQQQFASCSSTMVSATTGRVDLALGGPETAGIPVDARYDCLLINSLGKRRYLFYGTVVQFTVIDGGTAAAAGPVDIDGGTAAAVGTVVIDPGGA